MKQGPMLPVYMSARRKRVISTVEIQFNNKPAKMLLTELNQGVRQNGQTPNIIGICSYCVLNRPVFEWNQVAWLAFCTLWTVVWLEVWTLWTVVVSTIGKIPKYVLILCLSHIQPRAPYDFYHPYDFLPVRPSEAPVGILRWCCSRGHIRLRAPYGLTRLHTYGLVE